jgi:RimJ/RimL family protein N-acetyltransferase
MTAIPTLRTERLILRAPDLSDLDGMAAFYASDHSRFVGGPMSRELTWRVLAQEAGHWHLKGFGRWSVIEKTSQSWIGTVGLWHPLGFPEQELGWDIAEHVTGRGYATEAAHVARAYAYETLGWTTLISLIADGNDASAAVAGKLGATPEGPFTHERYGTMTVYRHPAPSEVSA